MDGIIKFLTTLAIIGILCLIISTIWTNIGWGRKIGRDDINWNIEKIKDLDAQKEILMVKLYKMGNKHH